MPLSIEGEKRRKRNQGNELQNSVRLRSLYFFFFFFFIIVFTASSSNTRGESIKQKKYISFLQIF
ncbi:hypothetical protein COT29_00515 [Candidatus Micrarchaeota archaeon CG08_land_8_20_14_0_20_59_11]|nr:MAG: hypothetical protein COT29_00515 [Candidatus Micrarchaeota archaeon CG08_land_8_20_14_0_20_59_11]